jgi:hypothetical protein
MRAPAGTIHTQESEDQWRTEYIGRTEEVMGTASKLLGQHPTVDRISVQLSASIDQLFQSPANSAASTLRRSRIGFQVQA